MGVASPSLLFSRNLNKLCLAFLLYNLHVTNAKYGRFLFSPSKLHFEKKTTRFCQKNEVSWLKMELNHFIVECMSTCVPVYNYIHCIQYVLFIL